MAYPSLLPEPTGNESAQTHLNFHNTIHAILEAHGLTQRTLSSTTAQHAADHNIIHPLLSGLTAGRTTASTTATHLADHRRIHDLLRNLAAPSPDLTPTLYPVLGTTYDASITSGGTFATLQNFLDAQGTNKTLKITGTYTAPAQVDGRLIPKNGQKLYGEGNCILVGNSTCESGIEMQDNPLVTNVLIDGMEIKNFKLRAIQPGDDTVIQNCYLHGNLRNAAGSSGPKGTIIQDNWIDSNGSEPELGAGAAGIKMASSGDRGAGEASIMRRNVVTNNHGNGLWCDVDSGNCDNTTLQPDSADNFANGAATFSSWTPQLDLIENNIIFNNYRRGVFYEVSRGPAWIRKNLVVGNNIQDSSKAAGIGVSAAKHVLIEDNILSANHRFGIHVGQVIRDTIPWAPGYYVVEDIIIRNNDMGGNEIFTDPDEVGTEGQIGCGGLPGVTCSNNT